MAGAAWAVASLRLSVPTQTTARERLCSQHPRSPEGGPSVFSSPQITPAQHGSSQWGRSASNPEFPRSTSSEPGSERGQVPDLSLVELPASLLEVLGGGPLRVREQTSIGVSFRGCSVLRRLLSTPARLGWGDRGLALSGVSSCSPTFPQG